MKKSTVRTIYEIRIEEEGKRLTLSFRANGFLYNMVRILTGTLLEVGLGLRSAQSVAEALESKDRSLAGPTAPAQGLCLWELQY